MNKLLAVVVGLVILGGLALGYNLGYMGFGAANTICGTGWQGVGKFLMLALPLGVGTMLIYHLWTRETSDA